MNQYNNVLIFMFTAKLVVMATLIHISTTFITDFFPSDFNEIVGHEQLLLPFLHIIFRKRDIGTL